MDGERLKLSDTKNWLILISVFFIALDLFVWNEIIFNGKNKNPEIYFLNVGQGDSELVALPDKVKVLIDGGPDKKILGNISSIFSYFDRRIDLVIMSHPQLDHFGGLMEIFKRYDVGAFIWSGEKTGAASFQELEKTARQNKIPELFLAEGDKIKYQGNIFEILSPAKNSTSIKNINDDALVIKFTSQNNGKVLFTADIDDKVEKYLSQKYDLTADILKVAHHGSKYSSSLEFLKSVLPKISIIEVGKNSYGHPTKAALARLSDIGSKIFRTDKNGIIKMVLDNNKVNVFTQNNGN